MQRITGRHERAFAGSEGVSAFVPLPLPPRYPELAIDNRIAERLRAAEHALARLDLAGEMVPSLDWFIYAFVRKEAVISSQIEGTQATLIDLLTFEADQETASDADVEEVCNYLEALSYARAELVKPDGLPISMRLLNEAHRRLMHGARGASKQPGEVRRTQNWIGGSRLGNAAYVPPPMQSLPDLLDELESYLHSSDNLPKLVRIGLAHVQFESIHPYLDGSGRIGRLLIALLLEHWGQLKAPLLYLSLFFKRHREEYFRRLTAVRTDGDWEGWTDFFLDGVATIAEEAVTSARELFAVVTADRGRVLAQDTTSVSAVRLFELLPNHPIITVATAMKLIETSKPTATRAIETLAAAGILVETTGKKRDRSFAYQAYIDRLRIGTELERR
ncbi:Fic family protein [Roseomonas gilardii]|uniref:Fic family protein n=1 Tax=Roseomonas gilardii TaxID=257708 RepID=A0ABU3MM77_9PROT|nr:Fic family protein [Roseomonas gilardii]MDT8333912.1 Fic family protein [Roseomonas gilardii]